MKLVLLPLSFAVLAPVANAAISSASLNDHSFLLQATVDTKAKCLSGAQGANVSFVDCFNNKPTDEEERSKAFAQALILQNNRLYLAKGFGSTEQKCLRASSKTQAGFSTNCTDSNSQFDVEPYAGGVVSDRRNDQFILRSRAFKTCLNPSAAGTGTLTECADNITDLYFSTRLQQPLVQWLLSNKNKNGRDVTIEYKDEKDALVFSQTLRNIKNGTPYSVLVPDYQSYLQLPMQVRVKTDNPRFGAFVISSAAVRSPNGANVYVNDKRYNIIYRPNFAKAIEMSSYDDKEAGIGRREPFNYAEDQSSLNPYSQLASNIPDGWVVAMFDNELFFPTDNLYKNMRVEFGSYISQDSNVQSARILYKNNGETFKLSNDKGGLNWTLFDDEPSAAITYGGIADGGRADISGPFARFTTYSKAWRQGSVFCEGEGELNHLSAPSCAMLKRPVNASEIQFDNPFIWQPFPLKTYAASLPVAKGEIFYQGTGNWELWYAKRTGTLAGIPTDKTSNDDWQFMGLYEDLIIR